MWEPLAVVGEQREADAPVHRQHDVEHRQDLDRPGRLHQAEDRRFADLVGDQHDERDEEAPLHDWAFASQASIASEQRSHTPAWACWPTSGKTFQQRWHFALGRVRHHRHARHVVERERALRSRVGGEGDAGGDREVGERQLGAKRGEFRGEVDHRRGLQAGADALRGAFERAGDHAADVADLNPAVGERVVAPPAGIAGNACSWTDRSLSGKRLIQASSAVNTVNGASHATRVR